jgi:putative aldouronate transport system permease protein
MTTIPSRRRPGLVSELSRNWRLYALFLPVALYFLIFAYVPMTGIVVAFKDFNYQGGIWGSPWNGWDNFRYFIESGKLVQVTINTILYNTLFLVAYLFFSILVALLISEMASKGAKKVFQTMLFLPYFISWVTVSALVYNLFNYEYGLTNTLLKGWGLAPVDIYADATLWPFILPFFYVWKWVGFGSVLFLAAIAGLDRECYEAASIDGANIFTRIRRITLPQLKPTIIILLLLGVGRIMRGEFDMFYQLIGTNGNLMDATDIIDTLVFRSLVSSQDFGMSSAAGLYQSVLCFVIILAVNGWVRRQDKSQALF